jgi:signal peptidase I
MEPTLAHGSAFLYDRTYYRHHPIRSGDVVLVRHGDEVWIKRVYATGGARFWTLRSGDQEEVRHDPIREAEQVHFARAANRLRRSHGVRYRVVRLRVPPGWVFLVGDNITSVDSRVSGPVDAGEILGRVVTLPGQRLGGIPDGVELSSPRFRQTEATSRPLEEEAGSGRRI